ncbi:MAG: TM2 domain-containing protein, partial [Firmicutes bacterium]|nr:TM2 domain-containing protein [Bacillota bacterium]
TMNMQVYYSNKSKLIALLLVAFLGGLGLHRIYLGRKQSGLIMLALSLIGSITSAIGIGEAVLFVVSCWCLVDLIALCIGKLTDAQGRPLKFGV